MWELRKVRLYGDNPSIEQSQSEIAPGELQGVAGGWDELCLGGETDTGIPQVYVPLLCVLLGYVCVLCVHFLLAPPIPLGAWSMALVL